MSAKGPWDAEDEVVHFGFAEQVEAAREGWLQGRYYSEEGDTVADFLSFRSVFEINPFVVGVSYARERRVYAAWRKVVERLLDVRELMGRAFTSLSNGEMRRVLFARALLKGPRRLVVEDPYGGLDVAHRARMQEVLQSTTIDESRILTEAAIYADKIAVDEETVRLRSHMAQLRTMIGGNSPAGRKIDFLIQEFNREANTIGSKCQNSEIAHVVVDLKSEIEKIREQIQNIE